MLGDGDPSPQLPQTHPQSGTACVCHLRLARQRGKGAGSHARRDLRELAQVHDRRKGASARVCQK